MLVPNAYNISVNCEWSTWGDWSSCTKTCEGGNKTRKRIKTANEANGGFCHGQPSITESCNVDSCPGKEPVIS